MAPEPKFMSHDCSRGELILMTSELVQNLFIRRFFRNDLRNDSGTPTG